MKNADVPINPWLPGIQTSGEVRLRDPLTVARRALCQLLVAATSEIDRQTLAHLIKEHGVAGHFSKEESAYLHDDPWDKTAQLAFSWRVEAGWVLLWSLGFVESLGLPTDQVEPADAIRIVNGHSPDWIVSNAKPRSIFEILDEADLILRCAWAVREADLNPNVDADLLERGVTIQRHYALNWLIGGDIGWDDVQTDT